MNSNSETSSPPDTNLGNANAPPPAVPYMARTRGYYRAMGYKQDFTWATFDDEPFTPLAQDLAQTRVALVTTAGPSHWGGATTLNERAVWSGATTSAPAPFFTDLAWDKESTHVRDPESYAPLAALQGLAESGVIGSFSTQFHSVPTRYSHRRTLRDDAPEILQRCRADSVQAVVLTAL
jgi:hypothetical protein